LSPSHGDHKEGINLGCLILHLERAQVSRAIASRWSLGPERRHVTAGPLHRLSRTCMTVPVLLLLLPLPSSIQYPCSTSGSMTMAVSNLTVLTFPLSLPDPPAFRDLLSNACRILIYPSVRQRRGRGCNFEISTKLFPSNFDSSRGTIVSPPPRPHLSLDRVVGGTIVLSGGPYPTICSGMIDAFIDKDLNVKSCRSNALQSLESIFVSQSGKVVADPKRFLDPRWVCSVVSRFPRPKSENTVCFPDFRSTSGLIPIFANIVHPVEFRSWRPSRNHLRIRASHRMFWKE
jgi:hypothetical protein